MPEGERRNSECYNKNIRCLEGDNRLKEAELYKDLGKRRPEFIITYIEQLQKMAESDSNHVVRIHSLGAIKATTK